MDITKSKNKNIIFSLTSRHISITCFLQFFHHKLFVSSYDKYIIVHKEIIKIEFNLSSSIYILKFFSFDNFSNFLLASQLVICDVLQIFRNVIKFG